MDTSVPSSLRISTLLAALVLSSTIVIVGCERSGQSAPNSGSPPSSTPDFPSPLSIGLDVPVPITSGKASISCDYDYDRRTDVPLSEISHEALAMAVNRCASRHMLHVYYSGIIAADFVVLITALSQATTDTPITVRILELDSGGGNIAMAMLAGEAIASSGWGLWVKKEASCLSACVLILAASSYRSISGSVGIHRIFPTASTATTRAELDSELKEIVDAVRAYLRKHGASLALADLMMTVPANDIRVLTPYEVEQLGLDGKNPAQADLDRIQLINKCGVEFVERKDAWARSLTQCRSGPSDSLRQFDECATRLGKQFGFPDAKCPNDGPMSLFRGQ